VLTGYGTVTKARLAGLSRQPDFIADNLLEAVNAIIDNMGTSIRLSSLQQPDL